MQIPLDWRKSRALRAGAEGRPRAVGLLFHMSDLAFDCVTCGACCFSRHPRYLVLLPQDQARIGPAALPPESLFEDGGRSFVDFSCGHCTHLRLETGEALCAVYDHRPEACRAFRAGSFECQKAIRANGVMGEKVRAAPAA
ncbi:Putative zinc-or iron-chelating domain-containing protein [Maricaulis salignorans]|uniref:Putative zinc-or iron-chelating domain-containing protein n=2 Tax=Maricaulis salignorans TaxID=144026 RepID=A0A1G9S0E1_9PROT|nr:Putative zinc-or iron-chelating domain-containing protein [Maricaulis salignorans]